MKCWKSTRLTHVWLCNFSHFGLSYSQKWNIMTHLLYYMVFKKECPQHVVHLRHETLEVSVSSLQPQPPSELILSDSLDTGTPTTPNTNPNKRLSFYLKLRNVELLCFSTRRKESWGIVCLRRRISALLVTSKAAWRTSHQLLIISCYCVRSFISACCLKAMFILPK